MDSEVRPGAGAAEQRMTFAPCIHCGSVRHLGLCSPQAESAKDEGRVRKKAKTGGQDKKILLSPEDVKRGLTIWDVNRPVREAVPNATIRIPKKVINRQAILPHAHLFICSDIGRIRFQFLMISRNEQFLRMQRRDVPNMHGNHIRCIDNRRVHASLLCRMYQAGITIPGLLRSSVSILSRRDELSSKLWCVGLNG